MCKQLKPGQLCTVDGKVYRCSKRTFAPCFNCYSYYGGLRNTPCEKWLVSDGTLTCRMLFGATFNGSSFPILVSMCKK